MPNADRIHQMMREEWKNIRGEQEFLKRCQLQYFLFSITVVGLFLGLSHLEVSPANLGSLISEHAWVFLTPLIVVLPCWWIFFDKCKTIARLVGYLRILEELSLSDDENRLKLYIGWERSMGLFREKFSKRMQRNDHIYPHIPREEQPKKILLFDTDHKYWVAHYYCFFFVSLICLIVSWRTVLVDPTIYILSAVAVIANTLFTFRILDRLIFGINSYTAHEEEWWKLLEEYAVSA
jgi:hypothetical protein